MNNSIHVEVKDSQCDVFLMNLTNLPDVEDNNQDSDTEDTGAKFTLIFTSHIFTGHSDENASCVYSVACSQTDATLDSFSSLAFSTDGQLLASGGFHGLVQNRDTSSGNLQCTVEGPRGGIEDSTVWMWNADRGAYLNMFSGHGSGLTCGDFTTDGKTICTGSDNATLSIWNPKGGENFHDGVTCLSWPGTSKYLVTGCVDGKVDGHIDAIQSLSVSAIRESLVSVSVDGTARVFEIAEFRRATKAPSYSFKLFFLI
ncbi:WD REPEATS REGION domain-containing protein [Citrus sinensis]|uniref:WD REPEATS REGION domain-containing protein n=1 Tax=Citrus sinensis TaxID=2711 RepID=A0ACB8KU95_CITSI|nr:WD REPEATS REGION domain-containing protein [Citrus sinensis]